MKLGHIHGYILSCFNKKYLWLAARELHGRIEQGPSAGMLEIRSPSTLLTTVRKLDINFSTKEPSY
jgi:hypothetical protein